MNFLIICILSSIEAWEAVKNTLIFLYHILEINKTETVNL